MSDRKGRIREHVTDRHAISWPILSGLSPSDLDRTVYAEGETKWSVHNVLAHLADAEAGLLGQMRRLTAGGVTVPADFDLQRWNRGAVRKRSGLPVSEMLDSIRASYDECLAFLEQVEEPQLDLRGRHSSGDIISLEEYFHRIADHRLEHAEDIRRALAD